MITKDIFNTRLNTCKKCEFWHGACTLGHNLISTAGCPLQKFPELNPNNTPDNSENKITIAHNSNNSSNHSEKPCCSSLNTDHIKPLAWPEVFQHLLKSIKTWQEQGFPMASPDLYQARIKICQNCPKNQYRWFQCQHCKCIIYTKAKLATESCPFNLWPSADVVNNTNVNS